MTTERRSDLLLSVEATRVYNALPIADLSHASHVCIGEIRSLRVTFLRKHFGQVFSLLRGDLSQGWKGFVLVTGAVAHSVDTPSTKRLLIFSAQDTKLGINLKSSAGRFARAFNLVDELRLFNTCGPDQRSKRHLTTIGQSRNVFVDLFHCKVSQNFNVAGLESSFYFFYDPRVEIAKQVIAGFNDCDSCCPSKIRVPPDNILCDEVIQFASEFNRGRPTTHNNERQQPLGLLDRAGGA